MDGVMERRGEEDFVLLRFDLPVNVFPLSASASATAVDRNLCIR
jgi:hypothetical protein